MSGSTGSTTTTARIRRLAMHTATARSMSSRSGWRRRHTSWSGCAAAASCASAPWPVSPAWAARRRQQHNTTTTTMMMMMMLMVTRKLVVEKLRSGKENGLNILFLLIFFGGRRGLVKTWNTEYNNNDDDDDDDCEKFSWETEEFEGVSSWFVLCFFFFDGGCL